MHSAQLACTSAAAERGIGAVPIGAADWFAVMAAAFSPPPQTLPARQWCELLSDEFAALGPALGLDTRRAGEKLRDAGDTFTDPWLVHYSRIFLVPPVRVTLNTGMYLEGALGGASAQMILQCYATAGFAPASEFHDLPDHLALQIEFIAKLLERGKNGDAEAISMAHEFCESIASHWTRPFVEACARALPHDAAAPVYVELAKLLEAMIGRFAGGPPAR